MANEVTKKAGTDVLDMKAYGAKIAAGIAESRAATVMGGGGKPLLRMGRDGEWIFGQSNEPVQEGSSWAINVVTLKHGYQCWVKDNPNDPKAKQTLKGEIFAPMWEPLPPRPPAIDGVEFGDARSFELKCTDGDDAGTEVLYKVNSYGGRKAVWELTDEIQQRLLKDPEHAFPVVRLGHDHYMHKSYGKTYTPVFEIIEWTDTDLNTADEPVEIDAESGEAAAVVEPPADAVEPPAATAANSKKQKAPLTAAASKAKAPIKTAEPAPTAANRTGQRRRPGR